MRRLDCSLFIPQKLCKYSLTDAMQCNVIATHTYRCHHFFQLHFSAESMK